MTNDEEIQELVNGLEAADLVLYNRLKGSRAYQKGRLTHFTNTLNEAEVHSQGMLESIMQQMSKSASKYDGIQTQLETKFPEIDELVNDRESYDNRFFELDARVRQLLNDLKFKARPNDTQTNVRTKLPDIGVPTFDGSLKGWLTFRGSFKQLVGDREDLSDVAKYTYLNSSCMAGTASHYVTSTPNSDYKTAWSKLEDEFTNDSKLKNQLVSDLYNVATPKEDDHKSLQYFLNRIEVTISYLKSLDVETDQWDLLLVFHLIEKLDKKSKMEIAKQRQQKEAFTYVSFIQFLKNRIDVIETCASTNLSGQTNLPIPQATSTPKDPKKQKPFNNSYSKPAMPVVGTESTKRSCAFCAKDHSVFQCEIVKKLSQEQLRQKVKDLRLCFNCLKANHRFVDCNNRSCMKCSLKHHTLLHRETAVQTNPTPSTSSANSNGTSAAATESSRNVVLATAIVLIENSFGQNVPCRAFLDSGSTLNFITTDLATKLGLKKLEHDTSISGINGRTSTSKYIVSTIISSRHSDYSMNLDFVVSRKIVNDLPIQPMNFESMNVSLEELADPSFGTPSTVDLLLGAEIFYQIFNGERIQVKQNLWLHSSKLGLIVAGAYETQNGSHPTQHAYVAIDELKDMIQRFWQSETLMIRKPFSLEEKAAEQCFVDTVRRRSDSHYEVALPINSKIEKLGTSANNARKTFIGAERRRARDPVRNEAYKEFMAEMLSLGHMEETNVTNDGNEYFMIHHLIAKPSSLTTKFRVVFNASAATSSGICLNEALHVGPPIQDEVFKHILRWRENQIAMTADISKMYRQIYIVPQHRKFQKIWWREHPNDILKAYELCTVTYGTSSAPFQATRALKKLAEDEYKNHPMTAPLFEQNFYVDDFMSSFDDLESATHAKADLKLVASKGGFDLCKFASNIDELTDELLQKKDETSVLGVQWNKRNDTVVVDLSKIKPHSTITRNAIFSEIAQLFDPIGLAAPVILMAKILMQLLWQQTNVLWDEKLPEEFVNKWLTFRNQLMTMVPIQVPRVLNPGHGYNLHGFCDASQLGFGACIYLVTEKTSTLICAKSRVAPVKKLTIPRLELKAAVLLAELMHRVVSSLQRKPIHTYYWTDSEITLHRIRSLPGKYNVYVAVRLAQIQEMSNAKSWNHVPTKLNSADVVSRGLIPTDLSKCALWWSGPEFLLSPDRWPSQEKFNIPIGTEEDLLKSNISMTIQLTHDISMFDKFSMYSRLLHVFAFVLRFIHNCKVIKANRINGQLTVDETNNAEHHILKIFQQKHYQIEIDLLSKGKQIPTSSSLVAFNPFLDDHKLLRVGGRLQNASLAYDQKHPILIPKSHIANLIVRHIHRQNFHCGPQMLIGTTRQRYWIIGIRNLARKTVQSCVACFHVKPKLMNQLMGDIHKDRLKLSPPFHTTGIDFAGPFMVRPMPRSKVLLKTYVCLFTCFLTRGVHLEIVSDLTTKSFLAALRRFVSRRGCPATILSDNATNFVGGRNELSELRELFLSEAHEKSVIEFCTSKGIQWSTIPPRSPHWGGLWESSVKQMKYHLKRTSSNTIFTPEGLQTIIVQIEGILNSRPLTPMSSDPNDMSAITPAHFWLTKPINMIPEPSYQDLQPKFIDMWKARQLFVLEIWNRFQREYFGELQRRSKWQTQQPNVEAGMLAIIHEDNMPPAMWCLGRVINAIKGPDDLVRVVELRTSKGVIKRSIAKVAILPIDN